MEELTTPSTFRPSFTVTFILLLISFIQLSSFSILIIFAALLVFFTSIFNRSFRCENAEKAYMGFGKTLQHNKFISGASIYQLTRMKVEKRFLEVASFSRFLMN